MEGEFGPSGFYHQTHFCVLVRNGIGKSTFIGALVRHELPRIPRDLTIGCVEQEISEDDLNTKAIDAVLAVDKERIDLLAEEKRLMDTPQVRLMDTPHKRRRAWRFIFSVC